MTCVLVVEDERGIREGLAAAVTRAGHRAIVAAGLAEARDALAHEDVDCVLLDIRLRDGNGLELLRDVRGGPCRDVPVIIATAYGDSERTIEAMRDGAFDFVTKPFDLPALLATVDRAVKQRGLRRALPAATAVSGQKGPLVGTSAAMLDVWKVIGRAAASDASVLIMGETGTGKELVARAIHDYSARAREPFVAVNLAALPSGLVESELLGHEKGSFTGASQRRLGRFELAEAGTLFLDEVGDLDLALQAKLLRVLSDGRFERVGGTEAVVSKARIVAATNRPVRPGEASARLREDLYYRLAVIEVEVPPLRDRRSDIPLLVAHALAGSPARAVSEDAMSHLLAYPWPGNVRELVHVVERAAAMCGSEIIDTPDLPAVVRGGAPVDPVSPRAGTLRNAVAELERRMIGEALERAGGNRSEAARQLGIARPQLYAKMQEHALGRTDRPPKST